MMEWIVLLVTVVVAVGLLAALLWWQYRSKNPKKLKAAGKDSSAGKAVAAARSFANAHKFRFIAPAKLAKNGKFADLDAIIIGYFGVLGVKALGYNGEIYGAAADVEWVQIVEGVRTTFQNPIVEASSDVRVIRDALFSTKQKRIPVEVVCVFTDASAQLVLPRGTGHYTLKEFKNLLGKEKYLEDVGLDLDDAENGIKAILA